MDLLPDCFDGYVCLTGHYCFTREGEVVLKQPLDPGDVGRTKELARKIARMTDLSGRARGLALPEEEKPKAKGKGKKKAKKGEGKDGA